MTDPHDDRFGCAWGSITNGRPDPQPNARAAMGHVSDHVPPEWRKPCKRRTRHTNRLPLHEWNLPRALSAAFLGLAFVAFWSWAIWRIFG